MAMRFRIRWQLEFGRSWNGLEQPAYLSLSPGIIDCELKSIRPETKLGGQDIALRSGVFLTYQEAEKAARTTQAALVLTSLRSGFGICFSQQIPQAIITDHGLEWAASLFNHTGPIRRDSFGIQVYADNGNTRFASSDSPTPLIAQPLASVSDSWKTSIKDQKYFNDRILTAYDFYASSRFNQPSRTRFLLLVISIESLLTEKSRDQDELKVIDQINHLILNSGLTSGKIQSLTQSVKFLKLRSIGNRARSLLNSAIRIGALSDRNAKIFFEECYTARSNIVHKGLTPDIDTLCTMSNRLEKIIRELLIALIEGKLLSEL